MRKPVAIALGLFLLVSSFAGVLAQDASENELAEWQKQGDCDYFEQTDNYLCFGFRSYWNDFGGVETFGYPITGEIIEDGRTVQYFERARFEWHPGVWPERHDVLQGRLGAELTVNRRGEAAFLPAEEQDDCIYYSQTEHNVCGVFADRWAAYGGLAVFGYPISEAFEEDGMTVQYFERVRMEHQPGVWPERMDVLLGLLGVEALAMNGTEPPPPPAPSAEVTVLAEGLVQPRGVTVADAGVYVAEAGSGGDITCVDHPEFGEVCFGLTGAITLVDDAGQIQVVDGLPSLASETEGTGVHDVAVANDGTIYAIIGLGAPPENRDEFGEDGEMLGTIVEIDTDGGQHTIIADLAAYEAANNPDGGILDSNPYSLILDGDEIIATDAGGNSLLRVEMDGTISTIATFESRMVPAPPFIPDADELPMEAVPTNVVEGPDGNYYVAELTGFPFPVGGARIYQVTPGGDVSIYAEGLTNVLDLAFDADGNLYAVEIAEASLLGAEEDPSSRIVKIAPDGTQSVVNVEGIALATGIAVGAEGELYVSNMALTPAASLVRIDLP